MIKYVPVPKPSKRNTVLAALCRQDANKMTAAQWILTGDAMELYTSDVMFFKHHATEPAHIVARLLTNKAGA